jgi:hypothetical protein
VAKPNYQYEKRAKELAKKKKKEEKLRRKQENAQRGISDDTDNAEEAPAAPAEGETPQP